MRNPGLWGAFLSMARGSYALVSLECVLRYRAAVLGPRRFCQPVFVVIVSTGSTVWGFCFLLLILFCLMMSVVFI